MTLSERKAGVPPPVLQTHPATGTCLSASWVTGRVRLYLTENLFGRSPIGVGVLSSTYGLGEGPNCQAGQFYLSEGAPRGRTFLTATYKFLSG
jgi:hypothetical protein